MNPYFILDESINLIAGLRTFYQGPIPEERVLESYSPDEESRSIRTFDGYSIVNEVSCSNHMKKVSIDASSRKVGCSYAPELIATVAVCSRDMCPIVE